MIKILDIQIGNTSSVLNMLRKCGTQAEIISNPLMLTGAKKIIISGVGAFDAGMQALKDGGWIEALTKLVKEGQIPILGICLGMQLMCKRSEEGQLPGLGWFNAEVNRFQFDVDSSLKIPHMGWNTVIVKKSNHLISLNTEEQRYYFVHSYHVICKASEDILATANYGGEFTAAINKQNLFGVQFHPEKSHRFGMTLLKRFIDL